ncbi:glycosyltransferase family 4 protein [Micrococcus lylae]|uniref:glycosyltransferase family 4 protein n=1 Tax=Micrococcus lylae TaxID=1273 RepID=UPI0021A51430|nr:glycosyltransferase family 4 protein [Micrococcus lylae]MCT2007031.1 glycosyltransferase family 4 protein [Micrococcus lylae]MCT2070829.1 glycosyltransferase family 4 protein [Micrococcus lylae]
MQIAYLLADPGIGPFGTKGASVHVQEIIRALRGLGHQVTVYCLRRGDKKGVESVPADLADLKVEVVPVASAAGSAEREVELRRAGDRMLAAAAADGADLVYERYALFSDVGARLAATLSQNAGRRIPLVMEANAPLVAEQSAHRSLHDVDTALALTESALSAADVVSCVSEPVAAWVRRDVPAAAAATVVIPNGVNTERIRPLARHAASGAFLHDDGGSPEPAARGFTVGFLGTLKPWHGTQTLLDAVAAAGAAAADWRIEFCGAGPQLEALREQAERLGLGQATTFHGAVAPESVPAVVGTWDVATAPYPQPENPEDHYFSPLKVYEYLAAGATVVASAVGEIPQVFGAGEPDAEGVAVGSRGVAVRPGDAQALAAALTRLAADRELTAALAAAGRADVQAHHTWAHRAADLLRLVRERTA